ncbi:MAG: HAMP domain-containing histidine kinase [Blautia sp.]|nr:HAMP domain-containing histidine kinase [Blautia sp.]MCM1200829.1 HAMP domain-containing histidine kinase [Bacteroides fragilis]
MFQKAHLLFTLLCAGTTTAIIVLISLLYLRVSENNLTDSQFRSFQNDMNTIAASLGNASSVSIQWLESLETQNQYTIYVLDNGLPFLYNSLRGSIDSNSQNLLSESLDACQKNFHSTPFDSGEKLTFDITSNNNSYSISVTVRNAYSGIWHTEYSFRSSSTGISYYSSLIMLERNRTLTQIVILRSLETLYAQVFHQRMLFLFIDLAAAAVLFLFAFVFTGRILRPLRKNQEAQMQFFAAASHELRTPLSVMLASAECCQEASAEEQKGFFRTIRKEGQRMNSLISDMLTLAHAGTNRFSIERKAAQLDTLCLNACEAFEPLCRGKGLSLSLCLPEDVPPRCLCDAERITQVLSILLHNAASYTPEGGRITLSLEYRPYNNNRFVIAVTDTGTGISDTDKKHIFERFYRAEKSRSAKEHFGLGLSIAYEIVTAHHGRIAVKDNPGGGTVFEIRLPG